MSKEKANQPQRGNVAGHSCKEEEENKRRTFSATAWRMAEISEKSGSDFKNFTPMLSGTSGLSKI